MARIQFSSVVLKLSLLVIFLLQDFTQGHILFWVAWSLHSPSVWMALQPAFVAPDDNSFEKCRPLLQNVVQFGFVWCFLTVQFRLCFNFFCPRCMVCGISVPWPGMECVPCIGKWSLHPLTIREVPGNLFFGRNTIEAMLCPSQGTVSGTPRILFVHDAITID